MVIQIVYDVSIAGRWFLEGQQYAYTSTSFIDLVDCYLCNFKYTRKAMVHYVVEVDGVTYNIPEMVCATVKADTPSTDMRGTMQRALEYEPVTDPLDDLYGKKDYVRGAKDLLGVDISDQEIQVDEKRNELLRQAMRQRNGEDGTQITLKSIIDDQI